MEAHDLQSDARYAEMVVRSKVRLGYGEIFITQYLKQKSITNATIQQALAHPPINWLQAIDAVIQKRVPNPHDRAKATQCLLRRGFPYSIIEQYYKQD